jgi:hypothetical protein
MMAAFLSHTSKILPMTLRIIKYCFACRPRMSILFYVCLTIVAFNGAIHYGRPSLRELYGANQMGFNGDPMHSAIIVTSVKPGSKNFLSDYLSEAIEHNKVKPGTSQLSPNPLYHNVQITGTVGYGFEIGAWAFCGATSGGCPNEQEELQPCNSPHFGIYCEGTIGGQTVLANPQNTMDTFGPLSPMDQGELGPVGDQFIWHCGSAEDQDPDQQCNDDVMQDLEGSAVVHTVGIGLSGPQIDWDAAAAAAGTFSDNSHPQFGLMQAQWMVNGPANVVAYVMNLMLAAVTAAATAYIFMEMYEKLPFISGGLSGNPFSQVFGKGNMIPKTPEQQSWMPARPPAGFGGG